MRDLEKHKHFKDRYSEETAVIGFDWFGFREIPDTRYPLPEPQPESPKKKRKKEEKQ